MMIAFQWLYTFALGIVLIFSFGYITDSRISLREKLIWSLVFFGEGILCLLILDFLVVPAFIVTLLVMDRRKNGRRLLGNFLIALLIFLNFFICDVIANIISKLIFQNVTQNIFGYLVYLTLTVVLSIMVAKFIGKSIKSSLNRTEKVNNYRTYLVLGNILFAFIMISINFVVNKILMVEDSRIYVINLMLFLAYMGSTLVMTHLSNKYNVKEVELVMKNQELGRVEEYSRTMEELYDNIRKFKHDYKNILLSLNTFIEEKDYDALERYYKKEILTTEHMLDGQDYAAKLKNIKIPSLKALLSSKLIRASQKGIEVYTDITEEISTTGLDEIDGLRVFGVLLDNAIEGTADLADKHLSFGAVYKGNSVVFVIENSCQDEIPPVFRLIEKGFSTKGENHGMGLYNVKEIINKYDNGLLNIESSEGIFRVELWIRMVS